MGMNYAKIANKADGKRVREKGVKKAKVVKFIWGLTKMFECALNQ
jgi:hypothetical protein